MGNYVMANMNKSERLLKTAELHILHVGVAWVWGILGFWLLFIPTFKAIKKTIDYFNTELAFTDKRVIGKAGFVNSASLDAPLNKVQSVTVSSDFFGKTFGYGDIEVATAGGSVSFHGIKDAEGFKRLLMNQIDEAENAKIKAQAQEMAAAMRG